MRDANDEGAAPREEGEKCLIIFLLYQSHHDQVVSPGGWRSARGSANGHEHNRTFSPLPPLNPPTHPHPPMAAEESLRRLLHTPADGDRILMCVSHDRAMADPPPSPNNNRDSQTPYHCSSQCDYIIVYSSYLLKFRFSLVAELIHN